MARRIYHKMDYRISFGLIWALVLVASTHSTYLGEQDMRGEHFVCLNFYRTLVSNNLIDRSLFNLIARMLFSILEFLLGFNVQGKFQM